MSRRPNVLWICTDQQRWDTLGCYGNEFVRTPHIDELAQTGTLFEHAICQSPVCSPSRASFLTGRYPRTTRLRQNGQSLPRDETVVPAMLARAGYTCGLAGKLHVSSIDRGYEPRIDDGYSAYHWSPHPAPRATTANKGRASSAHPYSRALDEINSVSNEYTAWLSDRGKSFGRRRYGDSGMVEVSTLDASDTHTSWCTDKAISFIERASEYDQPWLFSLNYFDPHHPFDAPWETLARYLPLLEHIPQPIPRPGAVDRPLFHTTDHVAALPGTRISDFDELPPDEHRLIRAAYWAMVDLIDSNVGRLLRCLEQTNQRDSTVVIFHSDHGEMLGDHGLYYKGPYFYEGAVRVPLIISNVADGCKGGRSTAMVELVDVAPTILELCQAGVPSAIQGRSLVSLIQGTAEAHRGSAYCEFYNALFPYDEHAAHATMVRTSDYKLVKYHGDLPSGVDGELYDLRNDPDERHNLWTAQSHKDSKLRLYGMLADRMAFTVDPKPARSGVT